MQMEIAAEKGESAFQWKGVSVRGGGGVKLENVKCQRKNFTTGLIS